MSKTGVLVTWAAATVIAGVSFAKESERHVLDLGGLRKVRVEIVDSPDAYVVTATFLPVVSLSPATNARINRSKGESYALHALAKHLHLGKSAEFTVSKMEVRSSGMDGSFYRLSLAIPRSGIKAHGSGPPAPQKLAGEGLTKSPQPARDPTEPEELKHTAVLPRASTNSPPTRANKERVPSGFLEGNLLSRKSDYLQTLHELKESFDGEVDDAEIRISDEDSFLETIVAVEERSDRDFRSIGTQIEQDNLLTFLEKDELRQEAGKVQETVLHALKSAVSRSDLRQEKANTKQPKEKTR